MAISTNVNVDLAGNLPSQSLLFAKSMDTFTQKGTKSLRGFAAVLDASKSKLDDLGKSLLNTAGDKALGGLTKALTQGATQAFDMEARLSRLGVRARVEASAIGELKKRIFEVAQTPDIRVDPTQMLSAVESIVEKTGDLDFALANLENVGRAISATGADSDTVAGLITKLNELGVVTEQGVLEALDALVRQEGGFKQAAADFIKDGKAGDLAKILATEGAAGALQKDSARAAASAAAAVQTLSSAWQQFANDSLSGPIQFFADAVNSLDPKTLQTILKVAAAGGALLGGAAVLKRGHTLFKSFRNLLSGEGGADDAGAGGRAGAGPTRVSVVNWPPGLKAGTGTVGGRRGRRGRRGLFSRRGRLGRLSRIASRLTRFGASALSPFGIETAGARTAGGAAARRSGGRFGRFGRAAGKLARFGASALLPFGVGKTGARIVGGAAARGGDLFRGMGRTAGKLARFGGRAFAPLNAAMAGIDLHNILTDDKLTARQKTVQASGVGGGFAGGLAGAAAGAAVGSVVPVIGTAIGGIVGGGLGFFLGEEIGKTLGKFFGPSDEKEKIEGKILIELAGSGGAGRVREASSSNPGVDLQVNTGLVM